jgi:hypothetical protein
LLTTGGLLRPALPEEQWVSVHGLERLLVAGAIDEDAAHGFGGGGEEMAAAVPLIPCFRCGLVSNEPQIRLVEWGEMP